MTRNQCNTYFTLALLIISAIVQGSAHSADLIQEGFSTQVKGLKGWTVVGEFANVRTERSDIGATCLASDGCGYAESPLVSITPGGRYTVVGWGRTEDDWQNNSCFKIKWYDSQKKPVWWEFVRRDSFSKDWKKFEKIAIAPKDAAYASIVCHAQAAWGKKSYFTGIRLAPAKGSSLLWDMRFDHKDYHDWMNDRSAYGNDGKSYCLSLDDLAVTQAGGAITFRNRQAKVRFPQSKAFSYGEYDEWVLVMQFFLEEPVAPMFEPPEEVKYNLIGAPWNFNVAYIKDEQGKRLNALFYRYGPDGSTTHPYVTFPIEPWKWYRLTLVVNNREKKIEGKLLVDGTEVRESMHGIPEGEFQDPPFAYVGVLDYPFGGNIPYPWGFWGKMDYIRIYDSMAAYKADEKNLVYGGFGKL